MASVNISLTKEAYNYLKMLKGKDKSFSEVILDMKANGINRKGSKENVLRFAGVLEDKNINWGEVDKRIEKFKGDFGRRVKETVQYMEEGRKG